VHVRRLATLVLTLLAVALAARTASAQLIEKKTLGLAAAKKMAAAAEAEATKNKWAMVIVVLDDGANLIYLERMDGAQLGSIQVAQGKARTAVRFRRPSKDLEDALAKGRLGVLSLGHVTAVQGGLPVMMNGRAIGSIGVSGGMSDQDEQCARAGLAALQSN
jgi:glc operon protein GlcG